MPTEVVGKSLDLGQFRHGSSLHDARLLPDVLCEGLPDTGELRGQIELLRDVQQCARQQRRRLPIG